MFRILVVEDDKELNRAVCNFLGQNGYEATGCRNANEAYDAMYGGTLFDMIISDIMMPGIDGFAFAQTIREQNQEIPILFMTARDDFSAKQKGFKAGIDDYMVKPFVAQEFVWRITAILRRAYKETEETSFLSNACKVDLEQAQVYKESSEPIALTAKEVEILKKLYANAGRIVTLGALCQTVCGDIYIGYEKTLMSHIRHIREKIEEKPSSPVSLITVKGIGYKLVLRGK